MPRKILYVVILCLISLGLVACELGWRRYTNNRYKFTLLYPSGWEKAEGLLNTVFVAKEPLRDSGDRFQENITVVVMELPKEMDLSTYFELNKDEIISHLAGMSEINEGDIFAGWLPGKWFSFQAKMQDLDIKLMVAIWMKGKRVYTLTCSSQAQYAPKYDPLFQKALRSLRIK